MKRVAVTIAVLAILALLGLSVIMNPFPRSYAGPTHETRALLDKLSELMAQGSPLATGLADPKAVSVERIRQTRHGNAVNIGGEVLHRALRDRGFLARLPYLRESNTDEDSWPSGGDSTEAMEVADAWGSPVIFWARDWLAEFKGHGATYTNGLLDPVIAPLVELNGARFALISMGGDSLPGTEDDIIYLVQ